MRTVRQQLARTSRIGILIQALALFPFIVASIVNLTLNGHDSSFVRWCADYWFILFLLGIIVQLATIYTVSFLLRCPHCRYRLTRAHAPTWAIAMNNSHVRYCAHCGRSLDEATR